MMWRSSRVSPEGIGVERRANENRLRDTEARHAFLLRISDVLRPLTDAATVETTACRLLCEHLGVDRVFYPRFMETDGVWAIDREHLEPGASSMIGRFPIDAYAWMLPIYRRGEAVVVEDVHASPLLAPGEIAAMDQLGIRALVCAPLLKDDALIGAFAAASRNPRRWPADDVQVVRDTLERTWSVVERGTAESARRESEQKYRAVFETLDEAVAILELMVDGEGRAVDCCVLEVNPALERMTGMTNTRGRTVRELFREIDERLIAAADSVARSGRSIRFEHHLAAVDRWFDAHVARVGGEGRRTVVAVFADISTRKQHEARLRASEERLRAVAASLPNAAVFVVGPDLRYELATGQALAPAGFRDDAIEGRMMQEIMPPEMAAEATAQYRRAMAGESLRIEHAAHGRHFVTHVGPVRDARGITGAIAVSYDVTDWKLAEEARQRAERELLEAEGRLRSMTDNAPVLIWQTDATGLTFCNRHYLAFFDASFETLAGMGWANRVHPDDEPAYTALYQQAFAERRPYAHPCRVRRHDGEYRWLHNIGTPLVASDGEFLGMVGCSIDVTDARRATEELQEADRRKDEFLATLAHELRNPLAPMRNAVAALRLAETDRSIVRTATAMMDRQVGQMTRLVDDLLDASRISRGRIELRRERVELATVVQQAVEAVDDMMRQMQHELSVRLPADPVVLDADAARLTQVLGNLLINACKFMAPGGRIMLDAERDGTHVVVRVRDEGIGIAPEMLPRVFDMFVQADTSLERSASGLGIGLTLVRSITELHGGTVEARSDGSGQGSEFVVRLPTLDIVTPAAPDRAPATAPALPSLRILIVDDNEDGAQSLAALLELQGHETSVAYRGTEVVPLAERFRPAVVLLDIGLPTINGYDVCRALRRQPWGAALVLIAVTGWGQEEDRRRSRAAGFDHHLVKPIEHGLLHEVLAASLARRAPSPSLEGP